MAVKLGCRAKAARTRAQKQPRAGAGRLTPHGGMAGNGRYLVAESDLIGCPPGQRIRPGAKTATGREIGGLAPHGERWASCVGWCREASHWAPGGARGIPSAKTAPGEGQELYADCAMGERQAMGVSGAGKHHTGLSAGTEGTPGRKNSPRRGPEAVWMRDMGVTCPGRSV